MKQIIVVSIALSLGAIAAQASIVTDYVNIAPSSTGPSGLTFSLPTFNPALGTLTGVELTLTPVLGSAGSADVNFSGSPVTISGATVAFNGVGSLQNSGLGMTATYQTSSGALTSPNYLAGDFPPAADGPALPFVWTTADSSAALTAAAYTALGSNLAFAGTSPSGTYAAPLPPDNSIGGYFNLGGQLEVDFSYTPVPEPTTMVAGALLLLPFGASTLRILRKNRVA